jgi:hypothetical protein
MNSLILFIANAILVGLCGYLWQLSGKGGFNNAKAVRRVGIPCLVGFVALLKGIAFTSSAFYVGIAIGLLYLSGYGETSPIYKLCKDTFDDVWFANFVTRFINGVMFTIPALFVGNAWLFAYIFLGSIAIAGVGASVKNARVSEWVTGSIVGLVLFLI